jgi:hypothetical protein
MTTRALIQIAFTALMATGQTAFASLNCPQAILAQPDPAHDAEVSHEHDGPHWVNRSPGKVTFDLTEIKKSIENAYSIDRLKKIYFSIRLNGVEKNSTQNRYAWDTQTITLPEPEHGQYGYFIIAREATSDHKPNIGKDHEIAISELNLRQTIDSQNINQNSFSDFRAGREVHVTITDDLRKKGVNPEFVQKVVELSFKKIVWVQRRKSDPVLRAFINAAKGGVDVSLKLNEIGEPSAVNVRDVASGATLETTPANFYFKVDAAFNGNAFSWDDMLTSLATLIHSPWLVRSTIEFWLDVQQMNGGVIPREVIKENLSSLWLPHVLKAGHAPEVNLQYTNPYLMHWVMETLYAHEPTAENGALLKRVLKSMEQYTKWIEKNRSVTDDHGELIGFVTNALGSGLDNSRGMRGNHHRADEMKSGWVDLLAQQISMYKSMRRWNKSFAHGAGPEALVAAAKIPALETKIKALEDLLDRRYKNEKLGFYFDIIPDGPNHWKQDTAYHSIAGFWALFSGSVPPGQLQRMIEIQMSADHFGGAFPFPANSLHALKLFEIEDGYWNGDARWFAMAMVALHGLEVNDRMDIAYENALKFVEKVGQASTTTVYEMYGLRGKFGKPENAVGVVGSYGDHETRPDFTGWSANLLTMVTRYIIGIQPLMNGKLRWNVLAPMKIGETVGVPKYMYKGVLRSLMLTKIGENEFRFEGGNDIGETDIEVVSWRDSAGTLQPRSQPVRVTVSHHR